VVEVEGLVGWRIIHLPVRGDTTGQIFNVSSLVVPACAPVANHDQDSMFPEFDKLIELAKLQVERERVRLEREQAKVARHSQKRRRGEERRAAHAANHRLPSNSKWRTWRGFVLDMQRLERLVDAQAKVTKQALAMLGPDSARTITRVMVGYGLDPDDWPPSTWNPDEERVYRPQTPL